MLIFNADQDRVFVKNVHIYDGGNEISENNGINMTGDHPFERFDVLDPNGQHHSVTFGVGISVDVGFSADNQGIDFVSAGVDFVNL